jgi:hypothetical protein
MNGILFWFEMADRFTTLGLGGLFLKAPGQSHFTWYVEIKEETFMQFVLSFIATSVDI